MTVELRPADKEEVKTKVHPQQQKQKQRHIPKMGGQEDEDRQKDGWLVGCPDFHNIHPCKLLFGIVM